MDDTPLIARDGRVPWAGGAAERQFLHRQGPGFASNDADPEELATAIEGIASSRFTAPKRNA